MSIQNDGSPLHMSLASMAFSDSFKKAASTNGYYTLGEILAIPLTDLLNYEWFTPAMLEELTTIVKDPK